MLWRSVRASWLSLAWAALAAHAAVRDTAPVPSEVGPPPVSAVTSSPALTPSLAPAATALAPPLVAPAAPSAPAWAYASSVGPELEPQPIDRVDALGRPSRALDRRDDEAARLAAKLYYTDPLTGLPNRAYLIERGASVLGATYLA